MTDPQNDFERAAKEAPKGVSSELVGFLRKNKKWWLAPIVIVILAFGILVALAATGAAPFIYTLF